ncbi:MAG: hypothetical protein IT345_10770 [Trueperaceae bacterium]|nr:hypothetical protein [Trueperaceae bacterium]
MLDFADWYIVIAHEMEARVVRAERERIRAAVDVTTCRCSPAYAALGYEAHALECVGATSERNRVLAIVRGDS